VSILKNGIFADIKPLPTCDKTTWKSSFVCDGYNDCGDWSDEFGCQCPLHKFECDCYQSDDGCPGSWRCI